MPVIGSWCASSSASKKKRSQLRRARLRKVFLADMADFGTVNGIYSTFMPDPPPARSTVQVAALPKGGLVEIEAIARRTAR